MKKKHLRALNSLEKWLKSTLELGQDQEKAIATLKAAIESAPEAVKELEVLPPPAEIKDEPETIALYTDGGCRGNPGPGAWAYVIQSHSGDVLGEGVEFESLTTNNKMELSGALHGLNEILSMLPLRGKDPLLTKVKIMTDSKYVVDGMKSWVEGWKARGWKKADNKEPENLELWKQLDLVKNKFMQTEWMWVKGHAGHPQNEYCDQKANGVMDENN